MKNIVTKLFLSLLFSKRFTPAGCSFWSPNILSGSPSHLAYSSTLSTYIIDRKTKTCSNIFSPMNSTALTSIVSIALSPNKSNLLACGK